MNYNEFLVLLGNRIRTIRKAKNIKQEKLAELVDRTTEHISFIERGERAPSLELLLGIARVLDISPSDLFEVMLTERENEASIPTPVPLSPFPEAVEKPIKSKELRRSELERMQEAFEKTEDLKQLSQGVWYP